MSEPNGLWAVTFWCPEWRAAVIEAFPTEDAAKSYAVKRCRDDIPYQISLRSPEQIAAMKEFSRWPGDVLN